MSILSIFHKNKDLIAVDISSRSLVMARFTPLSEGGIRLSDFRVAQLENRDRDSSDDGILESKCFEGYCRLRVDYN